MESELMYPLWVGARPEMAVISYLHQERAVSHAKMSSVPRWSSYGRELGIEDFMIECGTGAERNLHSPIVRKLK